MKQKLINSFGAIGGVLWFLIKVVVSMLPSAMIGLRFPWNILFLGFSSLSATTMTIGWTVGLVFAIKGIQDTWAIIFYIVYAVAAYLIFIPNAFVLLIKAYVFLFGKMSRTCTSSSNEDAATAQKIAALLEKSSTIQLTFSLKNILVPLLIIIFFAFSIFLSIKTFKQSEQIESLRSIISSQDAEIAELQSDIHTMETNLSNQKSSYRLLQSSYRSLLDESEYIDATAFAEGYFIGFWRSYKNYSFTPSTWEDILLPDIKDKDAQKSLNNLLIDIRNLRETAQRSNP